MSFDAHPSFTCRQGKDCLQILLDENWLQIVLSHEHWIWTTVHTRLIRSLTICLNEMIINNKLKDIVRLKSEKTINKIVPLAFSNKFSVGFYFSQM